MEALTEWAAKKTDQELHGLKEMLMDDYSDHPESPVNEPRIELIGYILAEQEKRRKILVG